MSRHFCSPQLPGENGRASLPYAAVRHSFQACMPAASKFTLKMPGNCATVLTRHLQAGARSRGRSSTRPRACVSQPRGRMRMVAVFTAAATYRGSSRAGACCSGCGVCLCCGCSRQLPLLLDAQAALATPAPHLRSRAQQHISISMFCECCCAQQLGGYKSDTKSRG